MKTVRVYHDKGLLPEPERDASGYRRYSADDAIDLIKIRTLAEAGVPLARIRDLRAADDASFQQALGQIDDELTDRIRDLRATRDRLRRLAAGRLAPLPEEVGSHLEQLARWGFSRAWTDLHRDLWILAFATHPDHAFTLFRDQAEMLANPAPRQLFLAYDQARGLDADNLASTTSPTASSGRPWSATGPAGCPSWTTGLPRSPPSSRARSTRRPRRGGGSTRSSGQGWADDSARGRGRSPGHLTTPGRRRDPVRLRAGPPARRGPVRARTRSRRRGSAAGARPVGRSSLPAAGG
ncbi:MerR family transcriptional regulator [Streptomyces parvus]|uniref:MerR family transcriptional regulator n=1 Tax=Streptomyces parvus TaxID=66428 RepID=UPI0035DFC0A7